MSMVLACGVMAVSKLRVSHKQYSIFEQHHGLIHPKTSTVPREISKIPESIVT